MDNIQDGERIVPVNIETQMKGAYIDYAVKLLMNLPGLLILRKQPGHSLP